MPPHRRWAILYDADCGFCVWVLSGLLRWDRAARLHPVALQAPDADDLLRGVSPAERMASWHLVSPLGERRAGGGAVAPLLRLLPLGRLPAAAFERMPRATDRAYRWMSDHRPQLSKLVPSKAKQRAAESVRSQERRLSRNGPHGGQKGSGAGS